MTKLPSQRALHRAKWLLHLANALEKADRLAMGLDHWHGACSPELAELRTRLRTAMAEVEALRRGLPGEARPVEPKRAGRTAGPAFGTPRRDPSA